MPFWPFLKDDKKSKDMDDKRSCATPPPCPPCSGPSSPRKMMKRRRRGIKLGKMKQQPFEMYAHKMVKTMFTNRGLTRKAALVMSSFIHDFFERLATEAGHLVRINHMQTMNYRHVLDAVRLVIHGSLADHAASEAHLALAKYQRETGSGGQSKMAHPKGSAMSHGSQKAQQPPPDAANNPDC